MSDVAAWEPEPDPNSDVAAADVVVRLQLVIADCMPVVASCSEVARTPMSVLVRMNADQRAQAAVQLDALAAGADAELADAAVRAHAAIDAAVKLEAAAQAADRRRDALEGRQGRRPTRPVLWDQLDDWVAECGRSAAVAGAQVAVVDSDEGLHLVIGCAGERCCAAQTLLSGPLTGRCTQCGTPARPHVWDRIPLSVQTRPGTRSSVVEAPTPAEVAHRSRKGKVLWEVRQGRRSNRAAVAVGAELEHALHHAPAAPSAAITAAVRAGLSSSPQQGAQPWVTRVDFGADPGAVSVGWCDGSGTLVTTRSFADQRPSDVVLAVLGTDQVNAAAEPALNADRLGWLWDKTTGAAEVPDWVRDDSVAAVLQLAAPASPDEGRGIEL